nr:hypothetical protein [Tanacetum cinerariifolium]
FSINKKKVSLDVDIFKEILQFCPKILRQTFEDLPLEHDILSFIIDLGHSRDIIYLPDVSVDYLHQPWRAFVIVINKCLSGKETGMDKILLLKTKAKVAKSDKKKQPAKMPKAKGYLLSKWRRSEDDESNSVDKSNGNDDDGSSSDDHDDERTESNKDEIPDPNLTNIHDEENINDEERMDEEEEDEKADKHVQSSFVSSDFTSKLLNLENPSLADNKIASLLNTIVYHATAVPEITSSFTKIIPLTPSFFNLVPHQATPTPTPTTSEATTSFLSLLDFSFVFRFNDRVTNLEKDLLKLKQVDQYAQAISSIIAIVD